MAPATIDWYLRWQSWLGWRFAPKERPWVPVGHAGPALILGHSCPGEVEPPLPWPCFQPVLLSDEDHERQIFACAPLLEEPRKPYGGEDMPASPRALLPEKFILPASDLAALQFMVEYFPHEPEDLRLLQRILGRRGRGAEALPEGYQGASWLLTRQGPIADTRGLLLAPELQRRIPEALRGEVRIVGEQGRVLWAACPRLPQPRLEDQLLNEFGEGWELRLLLDSRSEPSENGQGSAHDRSAARSCLSIDPLSPRGGPRGASPASTPGVIRITEREILDLERYDPRRSDRDPVRIFLRELSAALKAGASDLHLEPGLERTRVRVRVDGLLEERLEMSAEFGQSLVGAAKEMMGLPAERYVPQDGSCTIHHGTDIVSARVSSYPIRKRRQKLVVRFLPRRGRVPALDSLMPAAQARMLRHASHRPHGLILVCGPTGSGKTTTVFSTLADLNSPELNITTMEDPVEYELEGVNQAELDPLRGAGWDELLKGFLRQDPDAGLIGEIRDRATAEVAVRQALTGHMVFATLHTLSCAQTVERLINMGVDPTSLSSALTLVVSQRLVRRLCVACRSQRTLEPAELEMLARHRIAAPGALWIENPEGCALCRGGFSGRVAAVEMLPVTAELASLIEERRPAREFAAWAVDKGFPTLHEAALQLAVQGTTTLGEAAEWQAPWEDFSWQT